MAAGSNPMAPIRRFLEWGHAASTRLGHHRHDRPRRGRIRSGCARRSARETV